MKSSCKKFLLIEFIIFIIIEVIGIIGEFDIKEIDSITKLKSIYIPISALILIVYSSDKKGNMLCRIGAILLFVSIILQLLSIYEVVKYSHDSDINSYKVLKTMIHLTDGGLTICFTLAIFNLIPYNGMTILKKLTILSYLVFYGISTYIIIIGYNSYTKLILKVENISLYLSNIAFYTFIVKYLLNKSVGHSVDTDLIQQSYVSQQEVQHRGNDNGVKLMQEQEIPITSHQAIPLQVED